MFNYPRCFICGMLAEIVVMATSFGVRAEEPNGLAVAAALEQAFVQAIAQAEPSVVSIARIRRPARLAPTKERGIGPDDPDDPESPDFVPNDFGAGIIIPPSDNPHERNSRKAYILTNYHVVRGGTVEGQEKPAETSIHVRLANRSRGYDAKIYAADPRSDLAVLTIDEPNAQPIKLGDASKLKKGQLVLALGNPYAIARDGSASVSWGMVSNISRRPELPETNARESRNDPPKGETIHHLGNLLQVDTRLNLGTSGGALINLRGELVGITTSLAALVGYENSVGYAVPVDEAMLRIIKTLSEGKEVEYGFLGVSLTPRAESSLHMRKRPGAQVMGVIANSPAELGGIKPFDLISEVNGKKIFSRVDLTREIGKLPPEEKAKLTVYRNSDDEPQTVTVELGKWPVRDDEGIIAARRRFDPWRGLVVDYSSGRQKHFQQGGLPDERSRSPMAVLVTDVISPSPAMAANLEQGDLITHVNGKSVTTPRQFYETVKGLSGNVTLQVQGKRQVTISAP